MQESCHEDKSHQLSLKGNWWIAGEEPLGQIRGELVGDADGGYYLKLEGDWDVPAEIWDESPVILGETTHGDKVTLLEIIPTALPAPKMKEFLAKIKQFSKRSTSTYFSHWVLVGRQHFEKYSDVTFCALFFRLPGLEQWHGFNAFEYRFPKKKTADFSAMYDEGFGVHYKWPRPLTLADTREAEIALDYSVTLPGRPLAQTEAKISHRARIMIECKEERLPLDDFGDKGKMSLLELSRKVTGFFSMGMASPISQSELIGYVEREDGENGNFKGKTEIYRFGISNNQSPPLEARKMLFRWSDLSDDISAYFNSWLEKVDSIGSPIWLYLNNLHNRNVVVEQQFSELIQALEGLLPFRIPKQEKDPPAEMEAILLACPDDHHRKWLSGHLGFLKRPSLRDSLQALAEEYTPTICWLTNTDDMSECHSLIRKIKKTRVALAHCLSDEERQHLNGVPRRQMVLFMRTLLTACFLSEIGLSQDDIHQLIAKDWKTKGERATCFPDSD